MKLSSRGWFALTLVFSLSVLIFIFATTFNKQTIVSILSFNLLFLGLAILFRFLALVLWGVQIQLMAGSLGYRVSLPNCVNMVLARAACRHHHPRADGKRPGTGARTLPGRSKNR